MELPSTECPECGARVSVPANVQISEILTCGDCAAELEVVSVGEGGVKLQLAPEEDEDWGE